MRAIERTGRLPKTEKALVRCLVGTIHELRATKRPDADLVDALCEHNVSVYRLSSRGIQLALRLSPRLPVAA